MSFPVRVAPDLVNKALTWAGVRHVTVIEDAPGDLRLETPLLEAGVTQELFTAIVALYLRFEGHQDAKAIMGEAARLIARGGK